MVHREFFLQIEPVFRPGTAPAVTTYIPAAAGPTGSG
jgi:hypothetical protein